ncbi:hypothetical protein [Prescottella equi]|nr:hypothetical protein [Prescottella equi]
MSAAPTPPAPMLATLGEPPAGEGWAFEMKWDGNARVRGFQSVRHHKLAR